MASLDESLMKITRGAGIAFVGSLLALFLTFMGRVLVARIGTESEYGIFSIAFVVLNVCTIIAILGLQQGTAGEVLGGIVLRSVPCTPLSIKCLKVGSLFSLTPIFMTSQEPPSIPSVSIFILTFPYFKSAKIFLNLSTAAS